MQPQLDNVKVLFVDDDLETLESFDRLLEALGADVHTASSVDDAIELVERWHPDVIVSDISMPDQDGCQFIRRVRVRSEELGGRTPAIAVSGRAQAADQTRAVLAGFQCLASKPIAADQLVRLIRSVL
ncbi:MAG TPA: response regulator [Kofleriaceae bacterium]